MFHLVKICIQERRPQKQGMVGKNENGKHLGGENALIWLKMSHYQLLFGYRSKRLQTLLDCLGNVQQVTTLANVQIEMYDVEQKYLSLYRLSNHVISNHGNSICNIPQCFRTEHGPRLHSNTWKNASVLPVFLEINWHDWWGGSNTVTPHFHQANGVRWVVTFRKSERKSVFPF